jgi:hypothetical protein
VLARSGSPLLPAVRTHPDRPWTLIADAGVAARELLADAEPEQRIGFWIDVLPAYAELQRTVPVADLRQAQVPDLSPAALTATFDALVEEPEWFSTTVAPELDSEQWDRILASRSRLADAADRLAGGIPPTLQHDDLHDGNVFRRGSANLIIDWGDAVLAHPFGTLLVTLDVLAYQLDCDRTDPRIVRVQDAYLEVWRTVGDSRADLSAELDLAVRTAGLGRAAGWRRALGTPSAGLALGDADAVAHWLGRLANALTDAPSLR